MAERIPDRTRQQVVDALSSGRSCRAIATACGVSPSTVSRIAREVGHTFGEVNTATASQTNAAYGREKRSTLAARAIDRAFEALDRMHDTVQQAVSSRDGVEVVELAPNGREWRDNATAFRSLQQAALELQRYDERPDDDHSDVGLFLARITGQIDDDEARRRLQQGDAA